MHRPMEFSLGRFGRLTFLYPEGGNWLPASASSSPRDPSLHDLTPIHSAGIYERDLARVDSRIDVVFGRELVRRKAGIEDDQELVPQGIECVPGNSIDHRYEVLLLVEIVRSEDLVEAPILRDDRSRRGIRELEQIDGEQLIFVKSGHLTCGPVHISLGGMSHPVRSESGSCHCDGESHEESEPGHFDSFHMQT